MVEEGIEQLRPGGLGALLAIVVVDVVEQAVFVLQLEVVPVLATEERAGVAVLEFEIVDALEDLREGFALLEVEPAVVGGLRRGVAAVAGADVVLVGGTHGPAGPHRQRRVELPFDLPDVE